MNEAGLRLASFIGFAGIVALPNEPQFYVMVTSLAAIGSSIYLQIRRERREEIRYQRDKIEREDHQRELKQGVREVATVSRQTAVTLQAEIRENTELTREGIVKTVEFAETANNVNQKIAMIAQAALAPLAMDTNEVVHRIEGK